MGHRTAPRTPNPVPYQSVTHSFDLESMVIRPAPLPLNPPERLLMGPGPSNPDPSVLAALTRNPVGHLDPYFVQLMDETMAALRSVYRTKNHHTLPISATGSGVTQTTTVNLLVGGAQVYLPVIVK